MASKRARHRLPNVAKPTHPKDLRAAVEAEKKARAKACQEEVEACLQRHRCGFAVALTLTGDRQLFQVDVTPLD